MKEKALEILKVITYYPRKFLDFFLYHLYLKKKNKWGILKKYTKKPILIVGNGPSLNKTPLDKLKNSFVSIGMNKINLIYEKSSWRPDIITCVNGFVIKQNKEYFNQTKKVLIMPVRAFYLGIKPRKNVLFVNLKDQNKIEANIEKVLSTGCTVTFTALQIAAYLKSKSVNIVGVDHSFVVEKGPLVQKFKGDDVNHFSKDYFKNQYWGLPDLKGSEKLYKIAKDYFESNNIPITDYTVNGKLKIFNKGEIKDLFN
ncbi:MAG: 6-hydroxymethylpterin diphosphokinase MptE-like protein [Polaribacter sp.]